METHSREIGQPLIVRLGNVINIFDEISKIKIKGILAIKKPEIGLRIKEIKKLNYGLQIKK